MKNNNFKFIKIFSILLLIITIYIGLKLAKRFYFNEFYYKVPNLVGLPYEDAKKTLKSSALNIRDMGETFSNLPYGTVALQEPAPDSIVKRNRNIKIWVSKENPTFFLENLVGLNYLDALSIIEKNGLELEEVKKINSNLPINQVVGTFPKSGEPINKGTKMKILISNGRGN